MGLGGVAVVRRPCVGRFAEGLADGLLSFLCQRVQLLWCLGHFKSLSILLPVCQVYFSLKRNQLISHLIAFRRKLLGMHRVHIVRLNPSHTRGGGTLLHSYVVASIIVAIVFPSLVQLLQQAIYAPRQPMPHSVGPHISEFCL